MSEHFNRLTPAEAELLALIAEEAGEVIQAVAKILRHGTRSVHPDDVDGPNNSEMLERELGDLRAAVGLACSHHLLSSSSIGAYEVEKLRRVGKFLHHATTSSHDPPSRPRHH